MPQVTFNLWAILVSAVASMMIGTVWYSKVMFGPTWAKLMGFDMSKNQDQAKLKKMQKEMTSASIVMMLSLIVLAVVMSIFVDFALARDWMSGALVGLLAWIGFVGTTSVTGVMFGKRSWTLWAIDTMYMLVYFVLIGAVTAAWA